MRKVWSNMRMFIWLTLLTGVLYPLMITLIAQLTVKQTADGDFIISHGKVVGAKLIAQKFEGDKYFFARPSAIDYNPLPSGGSNLGPTNATLKAAIEERKKKIQKVDSQEEIPSELLFTSGSGLDPHISITAAYFQIERVAKARSLEHNALKNLIDTQTTKHTLGFVGESCVNVLMLNKILDDLP